MTATPKRRHFLRFSLRAMLVMLTVFCVWLGVQVNRANKQKAAVRWLEENGGRVRYDWQFDRDDQRNGNTEPPGPIWLRQQIGDEYFQSVRFVRLNEGEAHDLSPLANLTELRTLTVHNNPGRFNSLLWLGLSDLDLSPVSNLSELKVLRLSRAPVHDLSPVASLTKLIVLDLDSTQVSDISPLARLNKLELLYLSGTQVSDLSPLRNLVNLTELRLNKTPISDLSPLANLAKLKSLDLTRTPVTTEQVSKLRNTLPNCTIWR